MKRAVPMRTRLLAKSIGENLATWRKLRNLTSAMVADKAGVSRETISRLENGDPSVSLATFLTVCSVMEVAGFVEQATDPYETDFGRARASQELPQRVRR